MNPELHTQVSCSIRVSETLCWLILTVFAGKDASRALAQSSLKKEECRPEWEDLKPEHKKVLDDWFTFFSKRYNIKGKVVTGNSSLWFAADIEELLSNMKGS